jgi:hypothetical protein
MVEDIIPFDRRALKNGDHVEENSAPNIFNELGQDLRQRWEMLAALDHDVLWSLTDEQVDMLGDLFDDGYRLAMEEFHLPESFDATIKRMAVIIKRIGAVLTVLRMPLNTSASCSDLGAVPPSPEVLYCSDEDFKTLVMLAEKLTRHAALMTLMLPEDSNNPLPTQVRSDAAERMEQLFESLPEKFTTKEAIDCSAGLGVDKRSVMRYLSDACDNKTIKRTSIGHYTKLK